MPPRPQTGFAGAPPAVTTPCGFDTVPTLSTCHQWFPFGLLLASHLTWFFPGLFLLCSRPWLFSTAAEGGLEPAPVSRFRGAFPHRSSSYTHWALLDPLRSWRTVVRVSGRIFTAAITDKAVAERMTQKIDMEWIIVRPVGLLDKPAKGRYTAGPLARVAVLIPLSFDDCADCLLRAATDEPNWIGKIVN